MRLHANLLESPARAKPKAGKSKTRRMQEAFAATSGTSPDSTRPGCTGGWC